MRSLPTQTALISRPGRQLPPLKYPEDLLFLEVSRIYYRNYNFEMLISKLPLGIDNNGGCNTILGRALVSFLGDHDVQFLS